VLNTQKWHKALKTEWLGIGRDSSTQSLDTSNLPSSSKSLENFGFQGFSLCVQQRQPRLCRGWIKYALSFCERCGLNWCVKTIYIRFGGACLRITIFVVLFREKSGLLRPDFSLCWSYPQNIPGQNCVRGCFLGRNAAITWPDGFWRPRRT